MAQPTTDTPTSVATMAPSPTSAGPRQTPDTMPAKPVLFEDIDKVLLMRLYPDSADPNSDALAAGDAAYNGSRDIVASQQVPVLQVMEPTPGVATSGSVPPTTSP